MMLARFVPLGVKEPEFSVKEVEKNLKEAVQLILESQRELRGKGSGGEILKRAYNINSKLRGGENIDYCWRKVRY